MNPPVRVVAFVALLSVSAQARFLPQEHKDPRPAAGSVTGRITIEGKPTAGVAVVLITARSKSSDEKAVARTRTNADGSFRLAVVPSDHYWLVALAPGYVSPKDSWIGPAGKSVSVADGETVEGVDMDLTRGGVITGRITDQDGRPVVDERVWLTTIDEHGQRRFTWDSFSATRGLTDDRGIYRFYGLAPGRYTVSVGNPRDPGDTGSQSNHSSQTYYPGVNDESKATPVDVTAGGEATSIDIKVAREENSASYSVSGQIVDADTGKPIPDVWPFYGTRTETSGSTSTSSSRALLRTDATGMFKIEQLSPGRFFIWAQAGEEAASYSEVVPVEVRDRDLTGVVIKLYSGSTLSGRLVLDEPTPELAARLPRVELWTSVDTTVPADSFASTFRKAEIGPDGSFLITGLRPGRVGFYIKRTPAAKGLLYVRSVEGPGVQRVTGMTTTVGDVTVSQDRIDIGMGQRLSGVKVAVGYANGVIRGQLKIEGGKLPNGSRLAVDVERADRINMYNRWFEVDANGRFLIEDLVPGEYRVTVSGSGARLLPAELVKNVTVTNGTESQLIFTINLDAKDKDKE